MKRGTIFSIAIGLTIGAVICMQVPKAQAETRQREQMLWQEIIREQKPQPEKIIYITTEEETTQNDEMQNQEVLQETQQEVKEEEDFFTVRERQTGYSKDVQLLAAIAYTEQEEFINYFDSQEEILVKLNGKEVYLPKDKAGRMAFQYAMAVVVNRAANHHMGCYTIEDVLYAKNQYAEPTKSKIYRTDIPNEIYQMAQEILQHNDLPNNLIYKREKKWGECIFQIGNQYFGIDSKYDA